MRGASYGSVHQRGLPHDEGVGAGANARLKDAQEAMTSTISAGHGGWERKDERLCKVDPKFHSEICSPELY